MEKDRIEMSQRERDVLKVIAEDAIPLEGETMGIANRAIEKIREKIGHPAQQS